MKTNWIKQALLAGLTLAGLLTGQAVYAQAASTSTVVTVNAVVPKACRFYMAAAATLTINVDPADTVGPATGTANLTYRCQTGVTPLFDMDTGSGYSGYLATKTGTLTLTGPAAATMDVGLSVSGSASPGSGLGGGNDLTAVIQGDITYAQYGAAAVGTYTNTVTIGIQAAP